MTARNETTTGTSTGKTTGSSARAPQRRQVITERDVAILTSVFSHTALSRRQIQALHFGSVARTNARLLVLYRNGLLHRHYYALADGTSGPVGYDAIYTLAKPAASLVAAHIGWSEADVRTRCRVDPTHTLFTHALRCADFFLAARRDPLVQHPDEGEPGWHMARWLPERLAHHVFETRAVGADRWERVDFKPDGYLQLVLRDPSGRQVDSRSFMLEGDMGSMALGSNGIARKIDLHELYAQTVFQSRYDDASFLTLFVTTGDVREDSIIALAGEKGCARVRCTTWKRLAEAAPLSSPIWKGPHQSERVSLISPGVAEGMSQP